MKEVLAAAVICFLSLAGWAVVYVVVGRLRAQEAQGHRIAAENWRAGEQEQRLARLPEPDFTKQPAWMVMGWMMDGESVVLATSQLASVYFDQKAWVEKAGPYNLTRRECSMQLEFPVFTLLRNIETPEDAMAILKGMGAKITS